MFSSKDFFLALEALEQEKQIKKEVFLEALETALVIAYKKHTGTPKAVEVRLLPGSKRISMSAYQKVVAEVEDREKEISLEDARLIDRKYKIGDKVVEQLNSKEFGRIAAQTAKQVIMQRLRDAETDRAYGELREQEDKIVSCIVRRLEGVNAFVEISKIEAALIQKDQMPSDKLKVGDRIKVYVKKIKAGPKGPQIAVTRANAGFVKRLFELEVPEIEEGIVSIKAIVREAGHRTKMAVYSQNEKVDPVGACVGNRGMRVAAVTAELANEKIDIIPWCDDPLEFIARSLSPAKVVMVQATDEMRYAKAIVMDDVLSLAIGKDGQNARLAAKLTGWKVDVKPYSSLKADEVAGEGIQVIEDSTANSVTTEVLEPVDVIDDIGEELGELE